MIFKMHDLLCIEFLKYVDPDKWNESSNFTTRIFVVGHNLVMS